MIEGAFEIESKGNITGFNYFPLVVQKCTAHSDLFSVFNP